MAQTDLRKYTVQEKINKMDVDLIDISATLTGDGTSGDLMFDTTEIANAGNFVLKVEYKPINSVETITLEFVPESASNTTETGG